jgi:methylated-DNA-[protein]-cysteine S-methyltransferase
MNPKKFKKAFVDTPVGRIILIYADAPLTIARILLPGEEEDCNNSPYQGCCANESIFPAPDNLARMVLDSLNGLQTEPLWAILSRDGITELQQAVYVATAEIPYGSLASYLDIAAQIGRPRACRFVGSALAKNPFPILIPCHRVIRSDNKLGGFGGGLGLKRLLIDFEARTSQINKG